MTRPQRVAILGATGSIGRQALEVIDRYPEHFEVFGVSTASRSAGRPARYVVQATQAGSADRIVEMVTHPDCDVVLVAISGAEALRPTLAALRAGKVVALATKEVLVMAGHLVMPEAGRDQLRPVDSEHSAIWQCMWGESPASVQRLILTASGGPFWARPEADLDSVTVEDALDHPRWSMGPKVTVDSATLMNKGLELIEAHHFFALPLDRIDVVVHPQSIVHSLVEFVDGATKAQLGVPDMRLPIAVALSYPDRLAGVVSPAVIPDLGSLEFHPLDRARFPSVGLARAAAAAGPPLPAVLNAANEEAVAAFLKHRLRFGDIIRTVEDVLNRFPGGGGALDEVLEADRWARRQVEELIPVS